jgi:TonB family protein
MARATRRHRCRPLLAAFPVALVSALAYGQSPPPSKSAGEIALLSNRLEGAALPTLEAAIGGDDALARAVAARIAAVTAHRPFAAAIQKAWETERDPAAAAEQLRALLFMRGAEATAAIDARLAELAPASIDVYAAWLAANQPERFVDLLPRMAERPGRDISDRVFAAMKALDAQPDASERLLRAWLSVSTPGRWRSLLERLSTTSGNASRDAVLVDALNGPNYGIREATVWHLLARIGRGRPVTSAVLAAATSRLPSEGPTTWEAFGRELLARRQGRGEPVDRAEFLAAESRRHMADVRAIALLPQLTGAERQAVKDALGSSFALTATERTVPLRDAASSMRTIPLLWPGLLQSTMSAAKCKTDDDLGFASAVYRPDGRVAKLQIYSKPLSGACVDVLSALARLTLADPDHGPAAGAAELLVLPIDKDFVECSNTLPQEPFEPVRIGATVKPPQKIRDARPIYPDDALTRRITGLVSLEVVISPAGCITSMTVVRSAMLPSLDFAATRAVSRWRFTPTLADGKPVPVNMTVTVTFNLQ